MAESILADRYQLRHVIGRGGMGEVWSAHDMRLDRPVAVKLLSTQMAAEAEVRERFDVEARSAARLNHPNVVSVYDSGEHEGVPYLVMELLPGHTLADELALGPIAPDRLRLVGAQILGALSVSHQAGILHRDIKPGNVFLTTDGVAKVGDFGIAKSTEALHLTTAGMVPGTAAYLAPERVRGEPATPQSDIYSVGVLLYEALSGRKPFNADTPLGMVRAVEQQDLVPLAEVRPGLDSALVATVERAMAGEPTRRFTTASDMAASLSASATSEANDQTALDSAAATGMPLVSTDVPPTQMLTPVPSPPQRDAETDGVAAAIAPWWAGARDHVTLILVATVVVVFVLIVMFGRGSPSPGPGGDASSTVATSTPTTVAELTNPPAGLDEAIDRLREVVRP